MPLMQVQEAPEIPAGGIPQPSRLHLLPGSLSAGPLGRPVPPAEDAEPRGEVMLVFLLLGSAGTDV